MVKLYKNQEEEVGDIAKLLKQSGFILTIM